jgi:hypothetical protein
MYRLFFRFVVMTLTILTANLLTTAMGAYLATYKNQYKPLTFTLIGMTVIVVIFYPLFTKLEEWVKSLSVKVVKSGNSLAGKYLGLTLTFITALLILLYFYVKMWYHIDFIKALTSGSIGNYL